MSTRRPMAVRLYAMAASLLPPDMRPDRSEMVRAFETLWHDAPAGWPRVGLAVRSFMALPPVLMVEWLEFIGVRRAPGRAREKQRVSGTPGLLAHLRFAVRTLRKAPTFSFTSTLLVAVGVGSVTAIFTLVDHVLLRPLPYPDADRLVALDNGSFPGPFFRQLQTMSTVQDWQAGWDGTVNLVGEGEPLRLRQARVTRGFFDLFGAHAQRGRLLRPDDFQAADAVVLSAGSWRRVFGADPDVVGRTLQVDGHPVTVVGILEDRFSPPETLVGREVDLWRPLDWASDDLKAHTYFVLQVAGRLAPGADLAAAQAEVNAVSERMSKVHRNYRTRDGKPRTYPVLSLADQTVREVRTGLGVLLGAVGLLLLIACANVANLFLARGLSRTREMAVRRALGASTGGLTGQLLVESLVVGVSGGVLGAALAWGAIRAFLVLNPETLPRQAAVAVDLPVLLFAVALSALTSLVFGLLPALRSVRGELADELGGAGRPATSGRRATLFRNVLVTGEVALSLVLVAGAGLLLRSFLVVRAQDPGFAVADVWTVPLSIADPGTADGYRGIMDGILRNVRQIPGVESAAYSLTAPLQYIGGSHCCWRTSLELPGHQEDPKLNPMTLAVTEDYFSTLDVRIVAGRAWSRSGAAADPAPAVINRALAAELGGTDASVGLTGTLGKLNVIVVGVAGDTRHYGLDQKTEPMLYLPMERLPFSMDRSDIIVRVDPAVSASIPQALRRAVWAAEPGVPVPTVRSLQEAVDHATAGRRFDSVIFGTFGSVALLLAAGGLYGTLLYVTGQRRREMGIRLALGASRGRIEAQMLRVGIALGVIGVLLGLGGTWTFDKYLQSRLFGVGRADPWALGGAAGLLFFTAVLASWLPARRAGRVDPLETLRVE